MPVARHLMPVARHIMAVARHGMYLNGVVRQYNNHSLEPGKHLEYAY